LLTGNQESGQNHTTARRVKKTAAGRVPGAAGARGRQARPRCNAHENMLFGNSNDNVAAFRGRPCGAPAGKLPVWILSI
jgi:hypothetical protein